MLVLSRNRGQLVRIGDHITVKVVGVNSKTGEVLLEFKAPKAYKIFREEIYEKRNAIRLEETTNHE